MGQPPSEHDSGTSRPLEDRLRKKLEAERPVRRYQFGQRSTYTPSRDNIGNLGDFVYRDWAPTERPAERPDESAPVATLGMLDGAVVARLPCSPSMGKLLIGRSITAEIQIPDPFVHRIHAEIYWDPAIRSHVVSHSGGANGTFVNLQRITTPVRLADGARIRVGKTELVYRRVFYPEDTDRYDW